MRSILRAAAVALTLALALGAGVDRASAAPEVRSYSPAEAAPGTSVRLEGSGFGSRKPEHSVRYGTGGSPMGATAIVTWSRSEIAVALPSRIAPGLYWLALYEGDRLVSNRHRALRVVSLGEKLLRKRPGEEIGERIGRERDIRPTTGLDLAIEEVNPPDGTTLSLEGSPLRVWVKVRALRGNPPPFVVSAPGERGRLNTSSVHQVPQGHSIPVPIDLDTHPNRVRDGVFRTTVALGTPRNPMVYEDDDRANNVQTLRYHVPSDLLPVAVVKVRAQRAGGPATHGRTIVTVLVRNEGSSTSPATRLAVRDIAPGTGGSNCASAGPAVFDVPRIERGSTIAGHLPLPCDLLKKAAGREIEVSVDPDNRVRELDEGNNTLRVPLSEVEQHRDPPYKGWARAKDWRATWRQ